MEAGAVNVLVATVECREDGQFRLLGGGEAPAAGLEKGEITSAADFSEAVAEAAARAEKSAGVPVKKLYFNFDEQKIESAWSSGSRLLEGEGEIRASDVRAAMGQAERLVGDFERKIVYSAETDYTIDGKDPVADPIGVFGHELEVKAHFLLVRAARWDAWMRLLRRAGIRKTVPVLSGLSSAWGVLTPDERKGARILWDLGADYWNGLVLERGRIREYRTILAGREWEEASGVALELCRDFLKKNPSVAEVVLTGEGSSEPRLLQELKGFEVPVRQAAPRGIEKLADPRYASVAGLVKLASEMEGTAVAVRPEKSTFSGAREKVKTFLSDYF